MIVLGVDPGARSTGLALIDTTSIGVPRLILSCTVRNPAPTSENLLDLPDAYLGDVAGNVRSLLQRGPIVQLLAVEWVKRPAWRVAGKVKPLDPTAIMATSIVLGTIIGQAWGVEVTRIPPGRNGHQLPLTAYPEPLATTGKGEDKLRHERSAYDVAMMGPASHAIDRRSTR